MEARKNLLDLPDEVLISLLLNLKPQEIVAHVQLVNTQFKELANDNALWREIVCRNFPAVFACAKSQEETDTTSIDWMKTLQLYLVLEKIKKFTLMYLELHEAQLKQENQKVTLFSRFSSRIDQCLTELIDMKNRIDSIVDANDWIAFISYILNRTTFPVDTMSQLNPYVRDIDMLFFAVADLVLNELKDPCDHDTSVQSSLILLHQKLCLLEIDPGYSKAWYEARYQKQTLLPFAEFRNQFLNNVLKNDEIAAECRKNTPINQM